ncbi:MAG: diguanylate cyclase [Nitrospirae bacterium]|nr:diguanylate cyclase [Nitrospirota bacterium]
MESYKQNMFGNLKTDCIDVIPLKMPVMIMTMLEMFLDLQALEVLPVFGEDHTLKALYFKDCIPMIIDCENGNACKSTVPEKKTGGMPFLDILADEKKAMGSLKTAIESETSVALLEGGVYIGMVPLKQLISFVHRNEIKEALTTNPLTGLPGNYAIEKEFEKRAGKEDFAVCYVDISDFKAYNDKYGIAQGDEVIKYVSHMLTEACKGHFAGHVGGDDFVLITPADEARRIYGRITEEFDKRIGVFYNDRHRAQGYITAADRHGVICRLPLMRLALAAAIINGACSFHDVTESLAALKSHVKDESRKKGESLYAFDQRKIAVTV